MSGSDNKFSAMMHLESVHINSDGSQQFLFEEPRNNGVVPEGDFSYYQVCVSVDSAENFIIIPGKRYKVEISTEFMTPVHGLPEDSVMDAAMMAAFTVYIDNLAAHNELCSGAKPKWLDMTEGFRVAFRDAMNAGISRYSSSTLTSTE